MDLDGLRYLAKFVGFLVFLLAGLIKFLRSLLCFFFNLVEELQEGFRIAFKHVFGTHQAIFPQTSMLIQPHDLRLLNVQHLLNQKHLTLLLDQLPSVLTILGSLDWHGVACGFGDVHFALDLGVDRQLCRLDVGFTNFS